MAHPYCAGAIFASLARSRASLMHIHNTYKMVAFSEWLGFLSLREKSSSFLEYEHRDPTDPTTFLFSSNATITFFLYSEYRPISVAD